MTERAQHSDTLRAAAPLTFAGVTLLPIERARRHVGSSGAGAWCLFERQPHALVVRNDAGLHVLDAGGTTTSLEQLRQAIPHLDALLASL